MDGLERKESGTRRNLHKNTDRQKTCVAKTRVAIQRTLIFAVIVDHVGCVFDAIDDDQQGIHTQP